MVPRKQLKNQEVTRNTKEMEKVLKLMMTWKNVLQITADLILTSRVKTAI